MPEINFPIDPPRFAAAPSAGRGRVFLVSRPLAAAPTAVQVATVPAEVDVQKLVRALNQTAWTGDRIGLLPLLAAVPHDAAQSLRDALESLPDASHVLLTYDESPVRVINEFWTSLGAPDVTEAADAAVTLGLQLLLTNSLGEDLDVEIHGALLSSDREAMRPDDSAWWPLPEGTSVSERVVATTNHTALFEDPRWATNNARAFWAWIDEGDDTAAATWIFEFLDTPLDADRNFRVFVADHNAGADDDGALTPRNRFVLWRALSAIAADLDGALATDPWDPDMCITFGDMPRITHGQPIEWWARMSTAASELEEAARKGDVARLVPRTVAEEALIALAMRQDWVDVALGTIEDGGFQGAYDSLPRGEMDGDFAEVLPDLTGDTDVEMLWMPSIDGIEDPGIPANDFLGMGDYRPAAWHDLFRRAQ